MDYYNEIKNELVNNEINRTVKNYSINRNDLNTYYNVGKMLSEAGKHYGENVIGEYADKLRVDLNKKYNERTLRRYRQFYNFVSTLKWSALPTKLSWSHMTVLMTLSDEDEINYYIGVINDRNIGYRTLNELIKKDEYGRIDAKTKNKFKRKEKLEVIDFVKNPIMIKNNNDSEKISEKILQKIILEDTPSFLGELGEGFTFIKNEYPIKLGDRYNYIDLLLFNIEYNCYVVVELKVTKLKKEHIGQIQVYMNYIDENLKKVNHDKTIGIIICKQDNEYIIKYCSDDRIISRKYELI